MITTSDTTSRNRQVAVRAGHHITVSDILAFADQLRAWDMPLGLRVDDEHDHNTRHLIGLRVSVSATRDTGAPEPEGQADGEAGDE